METELRGEEGIRDGDGGAVGSHAFDNQHFLINCLTGSKVLKSGELHRIFSEDR